MVDLRLKRRLLFCPQRPPRNGLILSQNRKRTRRYLSETPMVDSLQNQTLNQKPRGHQQSHHTSSLPPKPARLQKQQMASHLRQNLQRLQQKEVALKIRPPLERSAPQERMFLASHSLHSPPLTSDSSKKSSLTTPSASSSPAHSSYELKVDMPFPSSTS